jgi:response regulator of citrate/malate metabolism
MENLNPLFFEYFIEAPLFEKQLVAWAMIQDKRINKKTAEKLLIFIDVYLSGEEADKFLKEWKRNQKLEYAFTGCGMEWKNGRKQVIQFLNQ